jgi:hypothetical protein
MRRHLPAGTYRLTLRERPRPSQHVGARTLHAIETTLPVTVN